MTMTNEDRMEVANTIRKQVGVFGLGVVGASALGYTKGKHEMGALTFKARLHFKGQTRARIMRVTISLNPMDYYDIHVTRPDYTEWTVATDMDAFSLQEMMYALDSSGVEK